MPQSLKDAIMMSLLPGVRVNPYDQPTNKLAGPGGDADYEQRFNSLASGKAQDPAFTNVRGQMPSVGPSFQVPGGRSAISPANMANPSPDYLAMHTQGPLGQANQVVPDLQRLIAQRQQAIHALQNSQGQAVNRPGGMFKYGQGIEQGLNNLATAPIRFNRR
jgi:hypothetical protein